MVSLQGMSPQNAPRGHGPARRTPPRRPAPKRLSPAVYWRRRAIVFGTPLVALIAVIALMVGGHGSKTPQATLAGNATTPTQTAPTTAAGSQAAPVASGANGACPASSIQVTPSITDGVAGGPIQVNLAIATTQAACNFQMSGANVAVKISSGNNSLWTSQNCSNVVPSGTLALHSSAPVTTSLSWDGHQSNGTCGATNPWVGPGNYQIIASVIGSTPTSANFTLSLPNAPTVTQTASPSASATPKGTTPSATPKK